MIVMISIVVALVAMLAVVLIRKNPKYIAASRAGKILKLYEYALNHQRDLGNQREIVIVKEQFEPLKRQWSL